MRACAFAAVVFCGGCGILNGVTEGDLDSPLAGLFGEPDDDDDGDEGEGEEGEGEVIAEGEGEAGLCVSDDECGSALFRCDDGSCVAKLGCAAADGIEIEGSVGGEGTRLYLPDSSEILRTAVLLPNLSPSVWTDGGASLCFLTANDFAVLSVEDNTLGNDAEAGAELAASALTYLQEEFSDAFETAVVVMASSSTKYAEQLLPVTTLVGAPPTHVVMLSVGPYTGDPNTISGALAGLSALYMTSAEDELCNGANECPPQQAQYNLGEQGHAFEVYAGADHGADILNSDAADVDAAEPSARERFLNFVNGT